MTHAKHIKTLIASEILERNLIIRANLTPPVLFTAIHKFFCLFDQLSSFYPGVNHYAETQLPDDHSQCFACKLIDSTISF